MAWKKAEGGKAIILKNQIVGAIWEGVYIGKEDKPSKFAKSGFQSLYKFLDGEGMPFEMWGAILWIFA